MTLVDILPASDENIVDTINFEMQKKILYEKIAAVLNRRERIIIEMRYGLITGEEKTQREIADMLGISRSYISRIEKKALEKLHKDFDK